MMDCAIECVQKTTWSTAERNKKGLASTNETVKRRCRDFPRSCCLLNIAGRMLQRITARLNMIISREKLLRPR
ncbi:hypothetical protein IRJ41_020280 [Triplophysa rosa]|uniref:Uncharacterized protein n=1 Tax=Triplophysa rosa TaxID=992332 RepID=A0A9W7WAW0_TRIRA|nr:hypothetical protein IRJ41_020280 [Triplophysa rosa]